MRGVEKVPLRDMPREQAWLLPPSLGESGYHGVPHDCATTLNKGHGRIERRECRTTGDPACLEYLNTAGDWPGLRSVGMVKPERREGG